MDLKAKGRTIAELRKRVDEQKLTEMAAAIGSDSSFETARLALFFGPTIAGTERLVERLGLDLSKALMGGQTYEWTRPFEVDETLDVHVFVDDVYEKGAMQFAMIVAEFRDANGHVVHKQRTTFIERS